MLHSRETCFLGDSRQAEISAAGSPDSAGYSQICTSLGITSELWGGKGKQHKEISPPCLGWEQQLPKAVSQYRSSCCFLPQAPPPEPHSEDADGTTGRVKSSWQYFTVFAQPSNVIFSAQCWTCLILYPFYIYILLTAALKLVGVSFWFFGWLVSWFPPSLFFLLVFAPEFCHRNLSSHWVFNTHKRLASHSHDTAGLWSTHMVIFLCVF